MLHYTGCPNKLDHFEYILFLNIRRNIIHKSCTGQRGKFININTITINTSQCFSIHCMPFAADKDTMCVCAISYVLNNYRNSFWQVCISQNTTIDCFRERSCSKSCSWQHMKIKVIEVFSPKLNNYKRKRNRDFLKFVSWCFPFLLSKTTNHSLSNNIDLLSTRVRCRCSTRFLNLRYNFYLQMLHEQL